MNNEKPQAILKTLTADKLKISFQNEMNLRGMKFCENHAEFSVRFNDFTGRLVAGISTFVLAMDGATEEKSTVMEEVKVPVDWWQAFRERWAPAWWLRRWPVVYRTIATKTIRNQTIQRLCPHVNVKTQDDSRCFQWLETGKSEKVRSSGNWPNYRPFEEGQPQ
jgi:hypothetical protein